MVARSSSGEAAEGSAVGTETHTPSPASRANAAFLATISALSARLGSPRRTHATPASSRRRGVAQPV